jgi:endonuclease I
MKKLLLLFLPLFSLLGQIPDYYIGIDFTQTPEELEEDLRQLLVATHSYELIYTPEVWDAIKQTDLDPDNLANVFLMYGQIDEAQDSRYHRTRDKNASCHTNSCAGLWVREHVFPKSLASPSFDVEGPGADAHAIRAIDSQMNNSRSNRKFGTGSGFSQINSQGFFYPGDEWKGDVARMMMYMHIRYANRCKATFVGTGSTTFHAEMPDLFLKWNAEDPVSEHERVRNEVLQNRQGNRNPFIDNPYLATILWGGEPAENTWSEMSLEEQELTKTEIYPNPSNGRFQIHSNKEIDSLSLYDFSGKAIFSQEKTKNSMIELNHHPEGTYFVLIYYQDKTKETKKLLLKK